MLYTARKFDKAHWHGTAIEVTRTRKSPFSPTRALLETYKAGGLTWEEFSQRYLDEMQRLYAADPQPFHDLVERAAREDVTLTCWEGGDEETVLCHRRLLRDFLAAIAAQRGLRILP